MIKEDKLKIFHAKRQIEIPGFTLFIGIVPNLVYFQVTLTIGRWCAVTLGPAQQCRHRHYAADICCYGKTWPGIGIDIARDCLVDR